MGRGVYKSDYGGQEVKILKYPHFETIFFWKKLIFLPSRARAMRLWFIKLIKNDSATSS